MITMMKFDISYIIFHKRIKISQKVYCKLKFINMWKRTKSNGPSRMYSVYQIILEKIMKEMTKTNFFQVLTKKYKKKPKKKAE